MTLLASEENLGKEAKAPPIADDLVTVSTRTDDVSCRLWPPDRRGPETLALKGLPTMCWGPPYLMEIR